jgi:hypothetical protein
LFIGLTPPFELAKITYHYALFELNKDIFLKNKWDGNIFVLLKDHGHLFYEGIVAVDEFESL